MAENSKTKTRKIAKLPEVRDPTPLEGGLIAVSKVKESMVPAPLFKWAEHVSRDMSCPIDYPIAAAIVLIGSLIGTKCAVRPKQNSQWTIVPNLYGFAAGSPSAVKTPPIEEVLSLAEPLMIECEELNDSARKRYKSAKSIYEARLTAVCSLIKKSEERQGEVKMPPLAELTKRREQLEKEAPEEPIDRTYYEDDATIEAVINMLCGNQRGVLIYRDEIYALLAHLMREENHKDRQFFNEGYNGTGRLKKRTRSRGGEQGNFKCISMFGAIADDMLRKYLKSCYENNDGLIQRFQIAVLPDDVVADETDIESRDRLRDKMQSIVEKLGQEESFDKLGAQVEESAKTNKRRIPYFRFRKKSTEAFLKWAGTIKAEARQTAQDGNGLFSQYLLKHKKILPQLSLIFYLMDVVAGCAVQITVKKGEVEEEVKGKIPNHYVEMATKYCEYLRSHAARIYRLVSVQRNEPAHALKKLIEDGSLNKDMAESELKGWFTERAVYRKNRKGIGTDTKLANAACTVLVDFGWLEKKRHGGTIYYRPHPKMGNGVSAVSVAVNSRNAR